MLNMWRGVNPTAPVLCHEDAPREAACETLPQLTPITEDHTQSRACSLPLLLVPSSYTHTCSLARTGPTPTEAQERNNSGLDVAHASEPCMFMDTGHSHVDRSSTATHGQESTYRTHS